MSLIRKSQGATIDSLALTLAKVVTTLLGIIVTKLIAVHFSLAEYGTYSQALLVVHTTTSITILGLTDAVTLFYNKTADPKQQELYINTIFGIECLLGSLGALVILVLQIPLVNYFENEDLLIYLWIASVLPLLGNLLPMLQVLFVSVGKAKAIAVRNLIISLFRLMVVIITCYTTRDLFTVLCLSLFSEVVQVIYFYISFGRNNFFVNPFKITWPLVSEILKFSIPMAIYVITNSLLRDIDKYTISYFMSTSDLAVYTSASKQLPFDLLTASFITVLIPIITRYINSNQFDKAQNCYKAYLRLGYIATWILASGAVVVAPQLMTLLYDPKYLSGLGVFIVYLFVDMLNFANVSNILAGANKTKTLMFIALIALPLNLLLNIIFIKWFKLGLLGPALATATVTFCTVLTMLYFSAKAINCKIIHLFNLKEIALIIIEIFTIGGVCYGLKLWINTLNFHYIAVLLIVYGVYVAIMLALNHKKLLNCLKEINRMK